MDGLVDSIIAHYKNWKHESMPKNVHVVKTTK